MKKFILWGVIGIILGIIAYSMWQPTTTELYVARDGKDDAKGTKSEPIRTLREAADRASAGTIVYVRRGRMKNRFNRSIVVRKRTRLYSVHTAKNTCY